VGDACDSARCSSACLVDCDDPSQGVTSCTGASGARCADGWSPLAGSRGCEGEHVACVPNYGRTVAFGSPVVVNVVLRASALQQIRATIAVSASQGCPIAFDVDAYAAKVAADASVTVDRVTVTVVCRDGQPALASGDQRRRSVQSDAAELIITVTITELTAAQAAVVSACCRVPRCMRVADISPLRSCLAVSHSPVFPAVLSLRVSLLVSLCRSVS
jgi:hypothetical protein